MTNGEPKGKESDTRQMIGLRYPIVGIEELRKIQDAKSHPHFSDTLAEALDEYRQRNRHLFRLAA